MVLVSAPAGFGKTTLLSEWSQQSEWPVVWVSLDATDNDPTHFWSYLVAALDKLESSIGEHILPLLHSPCPASVEYLVAALINSVATIPDHFVLVLDDYHCIESEAIHTALAYLVDYLPSNMHLILASRTDPPLPLARWRARGQLMELRAPDLRFSIEETQCLFNQVMVLDLPAKAVEALQQRAEGWIAGLQLAALAVEGQSVLTEVRAFRGDHQYVVDYLASEVLQQQPKSIRTFLLQTAILDTLNGSLCDAVTGRANGQATLEQLRRRNLFITAFNGKGQYRYHHLFADFLRDELQRDPSYDLPTLHLRAVGWYKQQDDIDQAIKHTLAAGRVGEAVQLIERTARQHLMKGEQATLLSWFEALPDQIIRDHPLFCLIYAWVLTNGGQVDLAEQYLGHLEAGLADDDEARLLLGESATVRARIAVFREDAEQNIHFSERALALLPEDATVLRSDVFLDLGFAYGAKNNYEAARAAMNRAIQLSRATGNLRSAMLANYYLADMHLVQGQHRRAAQCYQRGLRWCEQADPPSPLACWAHAGLGALLYEWDDLSGAVDHLRQAIELARRCGEVKVLMYARMPLAHALQTQGKPDEALATLQKAEEIARQTNIEVIADQIAVARVKLWLRQGEVDSVSRWLRSHGLSLQNTSLLPHEITLLSWFHWARYQEGTGRRSDDLACVVDLVNAEYESAVAHNCTWPATQYLIILALAYQALGHEDQAIEKLVEATTLAEPMELVRTFVDYGSAMATLLRKMIAREGAVGYTTRLLAAFESDKAALKRPWRSSTTDMHQLLIEPLRPREIEVLHHVARGLSSREIGDEMVLAVSTVKWYLRNIYAKLEVHRRTQAVAKARELNLI